MKPNKLHIILKIFGFLILSIGILYICQFFTKTFEEGFQSATSARAINIALAGCSLEKDNGRDIILCPDSNAVNTIFISTAVNLPNINDNVCVLTGDPSNKYYTCYTRPSQPIYNDKYGIYRDFDPIIDEDNLAFDLVPDIDTFCTSYMTNTVKINRGIQSTTMINNRILSINYSTNIYKNSLSQIQLNYCGNDLPDMRDTCSNISNDYNYVNGLSESLGLNTARTAVIDSLNTLSNISTKTFALYGSFCKESQKYNLNSFVDVIEPPPDYR